MLDEELRSDALFRRLVSDGLGAVLAKLEDLALLVRARPGAALAIKPGNVVHLQKSFRRSNRTHFPYAVEHGVPDCGDAGSLFSGGPYPEVAKSEWILGLEGSRVIPIELRRPLCAIADRSLLA